MPACESVKAKKSADRIERDKPIGNTAKQNQQAAAQQRQSHDAVRIDKPPPAVTKDMRQVVIL